jgi:heptosyltransferase II
MASVSLIKFLDRYVGYLLCLFLSISRILPHRKSAGYEKILVIQLWGIGETILALPAIKALREKYKKSRIDILVTDRVKEVFYNNKNIDSLKNLKLNPVSITSFALKNYRKYDLVIDMEEYLKISAIMAFFAGKERIGYSHGIRSNLYTKKVIYNDKQHTSETFLDLARGLGIRYSLKSLERLGYSKKDKDAVEAFLKDKKIAKNDFVVGIAPGAAESAKSRIWPLENYSELCNNILADKKNRIIFVGSKDESYLISKVQEGIKERDRTFNSSGAFNLNQLFCFIGRCDLFISNDAGAMHIAAAQGVKTIGLFGPNLPQRFRPYGKNNIAVYKGDICRYSPCINVHKGQVPECYYPKDSKYYQKCMKNIKVGDVLKFIR